MTFGVLIQRGRRDYNNPATDTFIADAGGLSQSWSLDATGNSRVAREHQQ